MPEAHDRWPAGLLDQWYVVATSADLDEGPTGVTVLGRPLVVWRADDGSVVVAPDRCPHREAPLSIGRVEAGMLVCAYHGWAFAAGGTCVRVPSSATGRVVPPTAHLTPLPVHERYGLVWASPGQPRGEPPEIPEDGDPAFRRLNVGIERWAADATRMADNFCDVAHFPYVHRDTLGADVAEEVGPVEVVELDGDFTGYRYEVDVDDAGGARVRQRMTTGFHLPFTVRSTTRVETADAVTERVLLLCTTPIDEGSSLFTFVVWRSGAGAPSDDEQIAFDRRVGAEDRAMLERIPRSLPLDAAATANVRSDRLSVEWRRRLRALIDADGQ